MRLLLHWDPEIDGEFRRAFERALDNLAIAHDSLDGVDEPREGAINVALASPAAAPRERPKDAILIIAGPGETNTASNALRLETRDIDDTSRRWLGVVEKLAAALDRRALTAYVAAGDDPDARKAWALAHASDPLAASVEADFDPADLRARLAAETQRADSAERALRSHERRLADALREKSGAEYDAIGARKLAEDDASLLRADLEAAQQRIAELGAILETTAFALSSAPADRRPFVEAARREAGLAQLIADHARHASVQDSADTLAWPTARYRGETRNGLPHGLGVMTWLDGGKPCGGYAGQFEAGFAAGLGVGDHDGHRWRGRWSADCPSGAGVLDHGSDGNRYEGEVVAIDGAPRRKRGAGHLWGAGPTMLRRTATPQRAMNPRLPGPG